MATRECAVCGEELSLFTLRTSIYDGHVCWKCLHKAKIDNFENAQSFTRISAKEMVERRIHLIQSFKATKKHGKHLQIDTVHKGFKIEGKIFEYSDLLSFELLEDNQKVSIERLGIAEAAVGGALFGRVGKVLGAIAGTEILIGACNSLELKVTLMNAYTDTVHIPFIIQKTSRNSDEYKKAKKEAQDCISALEIINKYNNDQKQKSDVNSNVSINVNTENTTFSEVDKILQYKKLLDEGIITQEEFDAKKKQIMNI